MLSMDCRKGIFGAALLVSFQSSAWALEHQWNKELVNDNSLVNTAPAVGQNGQIYQVVGRTVHALDRDGTTLWQYADDTAGTYSFHATPTIDAAGNIYVASNASDDSTYVYALTPEGDLRWRYPDFGSDPALGDVMGASPVIAANGMLLVMTHAPDSSAEKRQLLALNASNGQLDWSRVVDGYNRSRMALGRNGVLYAHYDSTSIDTPDYLVALDIKSSGQELWRVPLHRVTPPSVSPIVTDHDSVVIADDNELVEFDSHGREKWRFKASHRLVGAAAIAADGAYWIGSYRGIGRVMPGGQGQMIGSDSYQHGAAPAIARDGQVYAASGNSLITVRYTNGNTVLSELPLNSSSTAADAMTIDATGKLLVSMKNRVVFSFDTGSAGLAMTAWPMSGASYLNQGRWLDSDGDQLPDYFEYQFGLNPNQNDANSDLDNDGLSNLAEWQQGTQPNNVDSDGDGATDSYDLDPLNAEVRGSDLFSASVEQSWKVVPFPSQYTQPVVIAGPPSYNGADPGVVRIHNVNSSGFEAKFQLRFQEWDYRARKLGDSSHPTEMIPHIILEQGRHTMSDGSIWEVGTFDLSGTNNFQTQNFQSAFAGTPQLFLTAQTSNGGQAVTVRAKDVTTSGFQASLFEEQALMDGHIAETIGYLAIYSPKGSGRVNLGGSDQAYALQEVTGNSTWRPVFSSALLVEEEQSADTEVAHIDEQLNVLNLGGQIFAQDVSSKGPDTAALRQEPQRTVAKIEWGAVDGITDQWTTVPLSKRYSNPVVVATLGHRVGSDLGIAEVRNVTADSFDVRFREWDYLDQAHAAKERVFYLVAESGEQSLGGLAVKAGRTEISSNVPLAEQIDYSTLFNGGSSVFTGLSSANDADLAIPRVLSRNTAGFQVGLQEQQSKQDGHGPETLNWIAIQNGSSEAMGRRIEIRTAAATDQLKAITFTQPMRRQFPVVIQSLMGMNGADPATAEQRSSSAGVSVRVQEEQSQDRELSHTIEPIAVFGAE